MVLSNFEQMQRERILKKIERYQKIVDLDFFARYEMTDEANEFTSSFLILPKRYFDDFELMKKAILAHVSCIQFLGDYLRNDKEFSIFVIENVPAGLQFLSQKIKSNKKFALYAVFVDKVNMRYVDNSIKDFVFAVSAVRDDWQNYKIIPERLRTEKLVTFLSLKPFLNGKKYREFKTTKSVIYYAVKNCQQKGLNIKPILEYIPLEMYGNEQFVGELLSINKNFYQLIKNYLNSKYPSNDEVFEKQF